MILAATQSLAEFLSNTLPLIEKGHISFEHPQVLQSDRPCLNLYCYHIQKSCNSYQSPLDAGIQGQSPRYQWFDLTFLVSISDHTALGEQHLLSNVVSLFSSYQFLPEQVIAPGLQGLGSLPIGIANQGIGDTMTLWQVLRSPLRLSLHITLTIPISCRGPDAISVKSRQHSAP
jgi:Pvc16 N-terminal domain